jgi:hypothetical protein
MVFLGRKFFQFRTDSSKWKKGMFFLGASCLDSGSLLNLRDEVFATPYT